METQKKRRGDRKDGRLMRELDSLHYVTGILYPNQKPMVSALPSSFARVAT